MKKLCLLLILLLAFSITSCGGVEVVDDNYQKMLEIYSKLDSYNGDLGFSSGTYIYNATESKNFNEPIETKMEFAGNFVDGSFCCNVRMFEKTITTTYANTKIVNAEIGEVFNKNSITYLVRKYDFDGTKLNLKSNVTHTEDNVFEHMEYFDFNLNLLNKDYVLNNINSHQFFIQSMTRQDGKLYTTISFSFVNVKNNTTSIELLSFIFDSMYKLLEVNKTLNTSTIVDGNNERYYKIESLKKVK